MSNNIIYSIVIPGYKEEENLKLLLPQIKQTLKNKLDISEIIVVDTVEPLDNSKLVCQENGARYINRFPSNFYGDAVRAGIKSAKGNWIIFMDADLSHTPEFISKFIAQVEAGSCDLVIASRYTHGGESENDKLLVGMSKLLNYIYAKVLRIRCSDVSNSFRIYRADYLRSIKCTCNNFDVVEEILVELFKKYPNLNVIEIPYVFKKRVHGSSKRKLIGMMFGYLVTLIKLSYRRYLK